MGPKVCGFYGLRITDTYSFFGLMNLNIHTVIETVSKMVTINIKYLI